MKDSADKALVEDAEHDGIIVETLPNDVYVEKPTLNKAGVAKTG